MLRRRRAGEPRRLEAAPRPGWGSAICPQGNGALPALLLLYLRDCPLASEAAIEAVHKACKAYMLYGYTKALELERDERARCSFVIS